SGEKAIGDFFKTGEGAQFKSQLTAKEYQDLCDFEGNANGFKILTQERSGLPGGLRLSYATLGAFMKYPKESLPKKPTAHIADKKVGFSQANAASFEEVAAELGRKARGGGSDVGFCRHPVTLLVEASDDICYTIIDFEDGINLGRIPEDYALEYLIKLVKDSINIKKYNDLVFMEDRLSYLRALAINTLISDAISIFIENEEAILKGDFSVSLMDKSKCNAQIEDILKLSVEKIYNSQEVIEKEIAGYKIISDILEVYITALMGQQERNSSNYD